MNSSPSTGSVQDARSVLSCPALIRLVTEIDDHGPVPLRRLASTFADLTEDRLRRATDWARDLGLVRVRPGDRLGLTTPGLELADIYDAIARWARHHAYPDPVSDFISRVQSTLALLTVAPALPSEPGSRGPGDDLWLSEEALADLTRARDLLDQWLASNQAVMGTTQTVA